VDQSRLRHRRTSSGLLSCSRSNCMRRLSRASHSPSDPRITPPHESMC
jgi:hypothetical protein